MLVERPAVRSSPIALIRRADEALTGVRARPSPRYVRLRPGVYAERAGWQTLAPWDRYLARVHAYALIHPSAVFCLESAAALLGLPVFGEPRDIHTYDPHARSSQRSGDVCAHSAARAKPIRLGDIATTTHAETAVDLLRVLPPAFAVAVGDAVLRGEGAGIRALRASADDQSARRGSAQLEWVWPRLDERSESVGESVSRVVMEWCGFPAPVPQAWMHVEGFDDRLDFLWPEHRVGGESDGYGKYLLGPDGDPLSALKREKTREDRLRRHLSALARWDYADTMQVEPLQRKLALAGLPLIRPRQPAMLATLARHPRSH